MHRRHYFLLGILGLVLVLPFAALIGPRWYWSWVGRRNHEHFYQGKPTSYWSAIITRPSPNWASYAPTGVREFLDPSPAVLWGDPAAVPVLVELLEDENSQVRRAALLALGQTPSVPPSVVPQMMALLKDETVENRDLAAGLLTTFCSDEDVVVPALLPLLKDEARQVREGAIWSLAKLGPKAKNALPVLTERLRDRGEDGSVRRAAAYALARIGQQVPLAVAALKDSLNDEDLEMRVEAAKAFWHLTKQAETVLPVLVAAAKAPSQPLGNDTRRRWTVKQCRSQAVYALGEIGDEVPGVIPTVVEALDDPEVRGAACAALEHIGPKAKDAVPGLTRVVREEKHDATLRSAIRALGHIGPDAASAVPALTALLQRPDQTLRADAARALGAIGPGAKRAVPSLLGVYERDESPGYDRQAVASALHQIDTEAAKQHGIP